MANRTDLSRAHGSCSRAMVHQLAYLLDNEMVPEHLTQLPSPILGLATVGFTVLMAVVGMALYRLTLRKRLAVSEEMNNDVIFFASAINAFYGLTLGLIAVGVWRNYNSVQEIVSQEAAVIAALYRDVSGYPEPARSSLQEELRAHVVQIIEIAWPAQRQDIFSDAGTIDLTNLQLKLYAFEPKSAGQQLIHAEALRQFNTMSALRRQRIEAVKGGLPSVMWWVILIGALLSISVTYLLEIQRRTHYLLVIYLSTFTGLVIYVIYGLDHPLSGPVAIESTAYQIVLEKHIALIDRMLAETPAVIK